MPNSLLLLDTDILSLLGRPRPPPGLRPWVVNVGFDRLGVSFPVVTELLRGAHLLQDRHPQKAASIEEWVSQILATDFRMPEMTPLVAKIYARMTAVPALRSMWTAQRGAKRNRLGHDLMIASVALAYDAPIITANIRDYLRINDWFPLPGLYQPLEGKWYIYPDWEEHLPLIDPMDGLEQVMPFPSL